MGALIEFVLQNLNYWWVLVFMAIESSFIPFPSEVVVPPAAFLAMTPDNAMNIFLVVVVATLGADIGALVNYYLAKWLGRPIIYKFADSKIGHLCLLDRDAVEKAEVYFREHGAVSTFVGRLIPAVRQLISIPAGLAKMPIGPFLLYTTAGAAAWNTVLAIIGYVIYVAVGGNLTTKEVSDLAFRYSHEIGYAIVAIVIIIILFFVVKSRISRHKDRG